VAHYIRRSTDEYIGPGGYPWLMRGPLYSSVNQ
jgi:hypothetical protein